MYNETEYLKERLAMVQTQLRERGITDERVLKTMEEVPRHKFVLKEYEAMAYQDTPLPIGEGQTISQPFMVAIMAQSLQLQGNEKVLEIGTGSGYQSAILGKLSHEVYTVERLPALALRAKNILLELGYNNIKVIIANGTLGYPQEAPFSAILVTAGAPRIPPCLIEQLAEGGKLVIPIGDRINQILTLVTKSQGRTLQQEIVGCIFVPLIGEEGWSTAANDGSNDQNRWQLW
jgi:protein-L-isoaspartate(D-aspartate) O-methyltransferase